MKTIIGVNPVIWTLYNIDTDMHKWQRWWWWWWWWWC